MNAREAALKALTVCRKRDAWSGDALSAVVKSGELSDRDTALATRLLYGVFQNMALIDFYIGSFSTVRPEKMEPRVLDILRISVYQIAFMDRIPDSAAVFEAVALTKKYSNPRAASLVNAILRTVARSADKLPEPVGGTAEILSLRYSHPLWLTNELINILGADGAEAYMREDNAAVPVALHVNPLKCTAEEAESALREDGAAFEKHPWLSGCFLLKGGVERLNAFKNGLVYVQDPAAALSVLATGVKAGMSVLDGCAAPGGKSFAAAMLMDGAGCVTSCDIHENKLQRLKAGAERLGIGNISARCMDARRPDAELLAQYDVVIADVPCSGLGVIRKKPEIRYKNEAELKGLPKIQLDIIKGLSACVKPGGALVYSTCTVLPRENQDVIKAFLAQDNSFAIESFELPQPVGYVPDGMITLLPHIHGTDGFFICKMRKRI